jgi:hypothetical protein
MPVGKGGGAQMLHSHPSFATPYKAVMATTVNIFQGIDTNAFLRDERKPYDSPLLTIILSQKAITIWRGLSDPIRSLSRIVCRGRSALKAEKAL